MPSDPFDPVECEIDALAERRDEMDITQSEIGEALAEQERYSVSGSTLATRIGEWERGDRVFEREDLEAYRDGLAAIHADRTFTYPPCTDCEYEGEFGVDEIGGEPYCLVCGSRIRRDRKREQMTRIRAVLDDVDEPAESPDDEHRPLTAFSGGES